MSDNSKAFFLGHGSVKVRHVVGTGMATGVSRYHHPYLFTVAS